MQPVHVSFKQLVKDAIRELADSGELQIGLRTDPGYSTTGESSRLIVQLVIDDHVVASDWVYGEVH